MAAGVAAHPAFVLVRANHGAYPDALRGPFEGLGIPLGTGGFVALLLGLSALYLVVLALARGVSARAAIGALVAAQVLFALAPPLLSSDVFNYIGYARLDVVHHLNPYEHALSAAPNDATYPYVGWKHSTSAYGPLFTILTLPLGKMSVAGALWTLKALTTAAALGCVALVWRLAERLGRSPVAAALFVGLNPVWLVFAVGGAHNDLLMMAAALGGFLFLLLPREGATEQHTSAASGAAIVGSAAVKTSGALFLPFSLLGAPRRLPALAGAAIAAAVAAAIALAVFGSELFSVVRVLGDEAHQGSLHSVPKSISSITGVGIDTLRPLGTAISLAVIGWLLWRVQRGRTTWLEAAGWATFAVLVTTTYLLPWYVIWLLPLSALASTPNQRLWALLLCALIIGLRIPTIA